MVMTGINPIVRQNAQSRESFYLTLKSNDTVKAYIIPDLDNNIFVSERIHRFTPKLTADLNINQFVSTPCWGANNNCPLCILREQGLKEFNKIQTRTAVLLYVPNAEGNKIKVLELWSKYFSQLGEIYQSLLEENLNTLKKDYFEVADNINSVLQSCNWDVNTKVLKIVKQILTSNITDEKISNKIFRIIQNPFDSLLIKIKRTGDGINSYYTFTPATERDKEKRSEIFEHVSNNKEYLIYIKDTHWKREDIDTIIRKYGAPLPLLSRGNDTGFDNEDEPYIPKKQTNIPKPSSVPIPKQLIDVDVDDDDLTNNFIGEQKQSKSVKQPSKQSSKIPIDIDDDEDEDLKITDDDDDVDFN